MILDGHQAEAILHATAALQRGELVGLPTETVYGLSANACNESAVALIFKTKGRPADHPLIVHVASKAGAKGFAADVPDFASKLMDAFWPGPLTLILQRQPDVGAVAAGGQDSIGLRCPAHPVALALLQSCEAQGIKGLAAPSANLFGRVSPTTAAHVQSELGTALLVLDGGPCEVGIESTIIDCTRGAPVLLRPGHISRLQIAAACGLAVQDKDEAAPRASGTLASHYAPNAKVRLMSFQAMTTALAALGPHANNLAVWSQQHPQTDATAEESKEGGGHGSGVLWRQMPSNAVDAAHALFGILRGFDARGAGQIWIETPPNTPEWEGVRDRLQRAGA
jgi:L-threonylcarbamoyladenylate synthase